MWRLFYFFKITFVFLQILISIFKKFYFTNEFFSEIKCSVWKIDINSLANLVCVVGSSDAQETKISFSDLLVKIDNSDLKTTVKVPNLVNQSCRLFHLEECDYDTHILLVYFENKSGIYSRNPEIWLLDRSFRFYKLTNSFSEYFRLVIMHFGLPQWQLLFTDYGPTPQARVDWFGLVWFNLSFSHSAIHQCLCSSKIGYQKWLDDFATINEYRR